jgi:hypothetical protein
MTTISTILGGAELGGKIHHGSLTMIPLRSEGGSSTEYLTLAEALEAGLARIEEVSQGGSVPELRFTNSAAMPVLIVDGEELVGAKQNRVANLTILAPAKAAIEIPVSCVEAGRWRYSREDFVASKRVHFAKGRAARARSVSESLEHKRGRFSDQGQVWRDISAKAQRMRVASPTGAMAAIFDDHARGVEEYVDAFAAGGADSGAVFAIGAEVVGLDFFSEPATFRSMLPKLVRSYAVDALEHLGAGACAKAKKKARAFLDRLAAADERQYPAVGLGTDIRLTGRGVVGGALLVDDDCVHLAAFATPSGDGGGGRERARSSMASARLRRRRYEVD